MQALGIAQRFRFVIALRPDAALTEPVDIRAVCRRRPGTNVISGAIQRLSYFHDRDWDWGYLACHPASLNLWLAPYYSEKAW